MEPLHNIKSVSLRTGLSAHLIRIWEKRYSAVEPARSGTQRRLYSEEEVARLTLMARLTRNGLAISQIAKLSTAQLQSMADKLQQETPILQFEQPSPGTAAATAKETAAHAVQAAIVRNCLHAARKFDIVSLERCLDRAMVEMGGSGVLELLLVALLAEMGREWQEGRFTAAQEHFASSAIRDYLARNMRPMATPDTAPRILVGTPSGQMHELGAVLAASLARKAGWNVTYLGPSLPAEEIAGACIANEVRALALSIIYPQDDPDLIPQLIRLRSLVPSHVSILVGGQLGYYLDILNEIGATVIPTMAEFSRVLIEMRSNATPPGASESARKTSAK